MQQLPLSVNPCPIVDALFEIRFQTDLLAEAVFGMIYSEFREEFGDPVRLPILQLPEAVRSNDPNLKFKPHYRLSKGNLVIQIGPEVVSVSSYPSYAGWSDFSKEIFRIIEKLNKISVVKKVHRIGLRYINFFEMNDIFRKVKLAVTLDGKNIELINTHIRTEIEMNGFRSTIQVGNNVVLNDKRGSIIDIDTFKETELDSFFVNIMEILDLGHATEKKIFFEMLNQDFLQTLNPKY